MRKLSGFNLHKRKSRPEEYRKWLAKNPLYFRRRTYGHMRGFSEAEKVFVEGDISCACCGSTNPFSKRGWQIDHDHEKKVVRGVICYRCNMTIGIVKDSIPRLEAIISYLKDPPALRKEVA